MYNKIRSTFDYRMIGFSLCLLVPNMGYFQKYFGTLGAAFYLCVCSAIILIGLNHFARIIFRINERQCTWLALGTLLFILTAFCLIYPIMNSSSRRGGADRDEALNISATELLHARYPYYPKTQLGNLISPLPGAVMLAIPFVLLGNSAYQNFFWLAILYIVFRAYFTDGRTALLLCWLIVGLCPEVPLEIVAGSDFFTNSIYILVFVLYVVHIVPDPSRAVWHKMLASVLLGFGLASRANYVLLFPVLFSMIVQKAGWRTTIEYLGLTCLTLGALTIPFYLYDPGGFSPLHTANKIGRFGSVLPHAEVIVPLVGAILALGLSLQRIDNVAALFRNFVIIQAFLVLCGFVLSTIQSGRLNLAFLGWSLFFTLFGIIAFAPRVIHATVEPRP